MSMSVKLKFARRDLAMRTLGSGLLGSMLSATSPLRAGGIAAGFLAVLGCAGPAALADVTPPEAVPPSIVVQPSGLPSPTPFFSSATLRDAVVIASRGDQASSSVSTAQPIVLRWYGRDSQGAWSWRGPLAVPGWPAMQPVGPNSPSTLASGDRGETLAAIVAPARIAVARLVDGAWQSLGTVDAPGGEVIRSFRIFEGKLFGYGSTTIWAASLQPGGGWSIVSRSFAELGFGSTSVLVQQWAPDRIIASTPHTAVAGASAAWGIGPRDFVSIFPTSVGFTRGPDFGQFAPEQTMVGLLLTDRDFGMATVETVGIDRTTVVFLQAQPDGSMVPVQTERITGTFFTGSRDLQGSRAFVGGRAWSRAGDGRWYAGAYLSASGLIVGESTYSTTSAGELRITPNAFDCDQDGIDDAVAIASGAAPDCNANGRPDSCDIASGLVADADGDGVPDICAADCDRDGLADIGELRLGAPESCAHDGTLARCAIAAGALDRDGNGIPDDCDADRNGNGIPDVIEIADGSAVDCDGDWWIDDAPAYSVAAAADSGIYYTGSPPLGVCVLTCLRADPQFTSIDGFRFPIIASPFPACQLDGRPLMAFIAADPTADGDPRDAEVIWWQTTVFAPDHEHAELAWTNSSIPYHRVWQYIATPHLPISTPAFWVGFTYPPGSFAGDYPCNAIGGSSTDVAGNGGAVNGFTWAATTNTDLPPSPGFVLTSPSLGSLVNFTATVETFSHNCGVPGDFNGDGRVDGADLGRLLGDWGISLGSPCDLNHDNSVDGADLALLLAHFGN